MKVGQGLGREIGVVRLSGEGDVELARPLAEEPRFLHVEADPLTGLRGEVLLDEKRQGLAGEGRRRRVAPSRQHLLEVAS